MEPLAGSTASGGRAPVFGTVLMFDEHRGLGVVGGEAGGAARGEAGAGAHGEAGAQAGDEWPFHCTAIADGSRAIEVGTRVVFRPVPGHLGRMEAADIQRLRATGAP